MLLLRRFHQHTQEQRRSRAFISKKNALVHFFREHTNARRVQRYGTAKMVIEKILCTSFGGNRSGNFSVFDNHALSEQLPQPAGILTSKMKIH